MKLEVYPELLNPFILNDCIADCIASNLACWVGTVGRRFI